MTIIRTDMKKTLITKTDILPKILKQQTRLTMNQAKGKNRKFPNSMTSAKRKKRKLPDSIIQPNIGLFSDIWTRIPPRTDSRSGLPPWQVCLPDAGGDQFGHHRHVQRPPLVVRSVSLIHTLAYNF